MTTQSLESPLSCQMLNVWRYRVMLSGAESTDDYQTIAAWCEEYFDLRGSSVTPQQGRWHGAVDDGAVIEFCVPLGRGTFEFFGRHLQATLRKFDLSAYVVREQVQAMEVY